MKMNDTKLDLDADDLETLMKKGVESGQKDWTKWKENKDDDSILQEEVDSAASASLTAKNALS